MKKLLLFSFLIAQTFIYPIPSTVCIVRHAEKQIEKEPSMDGERQDMHAKSGAVLYSNDLSVKGWERAYALAPFFEKKHENMPYAPPSALFCPSISKKHPSLRPLQTLTPLAGKLQMKIQQLYEPEEYAKLAQKIMSDPLYDGKVVLISYQHQWIPSLARAFGADMAPHNWNGSVFDRVWVIQFDQKSETPKIIHFENRPQQLLYGDSEK